MPLATRLIELEAFILLLFTAYRGARYAVKSHSFLYFRANVHLNPISFGRILSGSFNVIRKYKIGKIRHLNCSKGSSMNQQVASQDIFVLFFLKKLK